MIAGHRPLETALKRMKEPCSALPPVLLVGGGKMGAALLSGWQEAGLRQAVVIDPDPRAASLGNATIRVLADASDLPDDFQPGAVVLAVKPQIAAGILPLYARFDTLFVSIMAGRTLHGLTSALSRQTVVRAMPNTPAAVRQGITVCCAAPAVSDAHRALCDRLLGAAGDVAWVDDEAMIDAVTAVSGGGPAYVFLLAELLEQAGKEQGLPPDLARHLARKTISGSGALLDASAEDAALLRRAVTSPNGTTQQALQVLMQDDAWPRTISDAIAAATHRSRELAE